MSGARAAFRFRHGAAAVPSVARLVGNTPLVRLRRIGSEFPGVRLLAKLEFFNPGGSVKDRAALQMILDAEREGRISKDKILIDSTSGNTGVAYAWLGAALGYRVALVLPSNVSAARKQITSAYGAELIYSDPMEGSDGAIRLVRKLVDEQPDRYFYPDQYSNESNPLAHYLTTAPEIWEQTSGAVTHFVCGIGTSGSVMGTGRRLKELRRDIQVVAVEPAEPFHGLEGLKHMSSSIVPGIYKEQELDEKLSVGTDEGWDLSDRLAAEEGLFVGHSGGAALAGALRIARRLHERGEAGTVVTLFPDRADRYFEPSRWERRYSW
ncbi:MAG TPA: cysteine synthase family protein [Myxococcaceae bacterium]|nr:cysteine synthase family protein [Myxococcaceae bacterium]